MTFKVGDFVRWASSARGYRIHEVDLKNNRYWINYDHHCDVRGENEQCFREYNKDSKMHLHMNNAILVKLSVPLTEEDML